MKWRNGLAALIGVWFIVSPWVLQYSGHTGAVWTSVVLGAVLFIASGWAAFKSDTSGWKVWNTWVSLVMGACFIVQPFIFSLARGEAWTSVILGAVTILLNLWTMSAKDESSHVNTTHTHRAHA